MARDVIGLDPACIPTLSFFWCTAALALQALFLPRLVQLRETRIQVPLLEASCSNAPSLRRGTYHDFVAALVVLFSLHACCEPSSKALC
jgi:hypothetical protein